MPKTTAFVARSFNQHDEQKISQILSFLDSFKTNGFFWRSAERAEVESVSKKVRDMIDGSDVFVGIFTRRYAIYDPRPSLRDLVSAAFGRQRIERWGAPPWVIQESGYALKAITSQRKLILFKETGVELPALQADLEYIEFDDGKFATAFKKASEMINALLAEAAGTTVETIVHSSPPPVQAEAAAQPITTAPPKDDGTQNTPISTIFEEMIVAIGDKDWEAAKRTYEKGLQALGTTKPERVLSWKCSYHKLRYCAGRTESLHELEILAEQNPEDPNPKSAIGSCFYAFQEYEKAYKYYLEAEHLSKDESAQSYLAAAAGAMQKAGQPDRAISVLLGACAAGACGTRVKKALYELLKEKGSMHAALAIREQMLLQDPADAELRFSLAYDYDTEKFHELSLFHYRILKTNSPTEMGLNNLGVTYSSLNLPILSVESQEEAFKKGNTLAAANLAQRYLDAGFASEATNLAKKAMTEKEYHPNLPGVLTSVEANQTSEQELEKSFLNEAERQRTFLLAFGEALLDKPSPVGGKWVFPQGEIPLVEKGELLEGETEITEEARGVMTARLLGGPETRQEKRQVRFSGKIIGRSCDFTLEVRRLPNGLLPNLSALIGDSTNKGYIAFTPDSRSGTVYELKDGKLSEPYTITRVA